MSSCLQAILTQCRTAGVDQYGSTEGYDGNRGIIRVPAAGGAATYLHVRDKRNKKVVARLPLPAATYGLVGSPFAWGTGPLPSPLEHAAEAPPGSCAAQPRAHSLVLQCEPLLLARQTPAVHMSVVVARQQHLTCPSHPSLSCLSNKSKCQWGVCSFGHHGRDSPQPAPRLYQGHAPRAAHGS